MEYFVYILKSLKDKKFYIGFTKNINQRLEQHNSGKVKSTKSRRPFLVVYKETYKTQSEALKREKYLKVTKREKIKILIEKNNGGCSSAG